ncbi:MAG: thiamine pyrophosphate-dependent dehydrogenase E1 component subunit alpha [Burkholderiales bacterium]|nr:thiamine pyrophosphate-dependent dehydrogenase E1 component subunit alpha [Burkholderiales bacterium]
MTAAAELLRTMQRIRAFEEALAQRADRGFQLFSLGQEAVAVGVCAALGPDDQLLTSGRSIAAALARGVDPVAVMAELLGKQTGTNRGRGGRGHLAQPSRGFFGAHAVVAGNLTIAAGVALALSMRGRGIAACMFGDGACGAGALHETMNVAAVWRLPLLLVCDNNGYSISTPQAAALAPQPLAALAEPFRMPARSVDGMDVEAVRDAAVALVAHVRGGGGPAFLECRSARYATHSTSTRETRPDSERAADRARDPIRAQQQRCEARGEADAARCAAWDAEARAAAAAALRAADAAPYPLAASVLEDVR